MSDFLTSLKPGELFERMVLGIIFLFQIGFAIVIFYEILKYQKIFDSNSEVIIPEENKFEPNIKYSGENNVMSDIVLSINNYLSKNSGGIVDFHILKDIVDRNIDNDEEEISNKISTPLYLGLVGTMVGIVIGLWNIDLSTSATNSELNVSPLIDGVKWAMSVSVIGLFLTTLLSVHFFRKAKTIVNYGRNTFLSLLQTDLLPSLIRSEDAAIQELSNRLNHFSVNTPKYIDSLSDNTSRLKESVDTELNILKEIKQLDIKKMSSSNVEIFYSLSGMMEQFEAFPRYYKELNSSLGNTISLNKNLQGLVSSTQDVNAILREVKEIIETGTEATTFFNAHIQSFEKYADSVNQSVAIADQKMDKAMTDLGEAVKKQYDVFSVAIAEYDKKLVEAFDNSILKFNKAFENTTPKFDQLNHLNSIDSKLDGVNSLSQKFSSLQTLMEKQNELLKDFNISLPSDLNLKLKREKGVFFYVREGLIILASVSVISYVAIHFISKLI